MSEPAPLGPSRSLGILAAVALAGAGTMVVELAAVRLLAPWFGASVGVWTNVIGVVLLALALGYLAGARLAARAEPQRSLGLALLAAGVLSAFLPFAARFVARLFLPEGVTLDRAAGLVAWGSLASSLLLFLPAAMCLGCVGPLAVEVVQVRGRLHAGTAGGRVLFASTLGSLAGTFGTTHALLPWLGLKLTFAAAGALLVVLGLCMLRGARRLSAPALVVAAATLAAFVLPARSGPALPDSLRLLADAQSPYQSVRVVETVGDEPRLRFLQVNESFDSFQSVWQAEPGLLPPSFYYNGFALPPWWSTPREEWRVLVLGLGAGTAWRVLEGALPPGVQLSADGVEIDPLVVELAQAHLDLPADDAERRVLSGWDARAALASLPLDAYDEIVLDTYANQTEIPAHLCSREFFAELHAHLAPGGWLVANVGGFDFEDPVVEAVAHTVARAFAPERALALRVPFARNCLLYARRGAALPEPGGAGWAVADERIAAWLAPLEIEGAHRWFSPADGNELTDDRPSIERLQRLSIERAAQALRAEAP